MHKFLKKTLVLLTIFVFAICILTACNKTIKFKLNFIVDGAIYFTIDTEGNNTIEFPTNPTKDSHTFDGWYWDENTWQQPFTANSLLDVPLSSDINVYAKFNHIHSDNDWLTISSSPATEDSEGYINYTCRVCGENKTETINKLDHIHNYSYEWQANSAQHWHECPKDGDKVDLADHIYDLSEIVLQPTEDTTGTIKYTCSTCNYSKTETLEKLPHTHKYSTDWQTNSTQHWHECPKDGDKSNIANHDYDNGFITKDPTEFDYGEIVYTCLVCEYKKSEQLPKLIIDRSGAELLSAEGFTFVDNNGKISLSNATETYSFINKIQVSDYATWTISTDIYGINTISTKTIPLAIGDNVVYLLITSGDGKSMSFYTMTVRRRPVYTVSFNTGIETSVPNQYIEETYCASEPDAIQRDGYTYTWDHSFENPIMQETTIDAIWTPNIDTKYKVEYYHQNLENDNFSLIASDTFTGTTDTIINANVKEYEHFTFNESISTLSENLNGDESTILKVYYDRNSYKVTIASTANVTINNPIDGYYKYGHTIPSTTATFNNYLGYEYLGWYKNGTCVAEHTIPSFSVSDNIEYVAKDKARNDISLFTFTSTTKECIITGLLDKTLTSVTLPNYTTQINNSVFKNCTNLTSIVIPSSITHIGTDAFYNCNSLTSVDYTGTIDQWVQIKFGNYYSNPIYYAENLYINNELVTEANITTATSINAYAFYSCDSLTSVTIGNSVTSIGDDAFCGCDSLTSVTIGNSVTSIGDDAFCGCDSLMSVTIGNSVTSIGSYAFYNCSSLTSIVIPDSVTRLGAHALGGCNSLVSITVPFVSSSIGYLFSTFQSAGSIAIKYYYNEVNTSYYNTYYIPSGLKSVTVTGGNIPYKSFYDCDNITSITIGDSVTSIEERAFYDCNGLTSVTIGNSVTSIGSSAFYGCARLIEVYNLSSLSITAGSTSNGYVGCYAKDIYTSFDTSSKLSTDSNGYIIYTNGKEKILVGYSGNETELTLPNDITEIYRYAFYNYASLTRITIGNTTTSIGDWAFYNCPIEYASMPTTAISAIPKGKLKEVVITSGNGIGSSAFHSCNALTSVTIGNSVTSIGSQAFSYCFSLTNVTIGNSVTSIGENAFYNCSSLSSVNINSIESWCGITFETDYSNPLYCAKKLYLNGEIVTNLVIPNTVTKIKDYAFYDYDDLTSIIIPNSVNSIERYAFRYCSNLTICCKAESKPSGWDSSWNYSNRPVVWGISEGILVVINDTKYYLEDTNAIVTGCKGTLTELIIPSTITYNNSNYSVTSICDKAFLDCNGLTSVTIPDSVTSIGSSAFYNCDGLTSVTIPDSVTSIGSSAFYDCDGLTSIIIPTSVTNIEDHAFSYCSNLTICCKAESKPSGWGFYWNYSYRPAVWGINEGIVVVINDTKYYLEDANAIVTGCQGTLTELIIPSTITYNNSNYSVTSICDNAFYDCNVLTSVTIGNFVTSIGKNAFESCDRLISITIGNSVTSIGDFAFYDCDGLTSVTIPDSVTSIESYAFYDCDGLLRVAIGNSITSIGDFAFSSCPIEYANIPTKFISSIPQSKLKELVITSGDVIENNAFYKCTSLISVTIPNSITNIGDSAFFGCTSLTSINLPYSVISIADYVFSSCSSLTRVIIPNSVMSMGEFAFESCSRLTIYCEAESKPSGWSSSWNNSNRPVEWGFRDIIIINGFTYSVNSSNAILVTNDGTQTDLVIPSTIEHVGTTLSVIGIESEAFYGHTNLTSVTIPNSITSIGDSAFFGCSSLTSVVIPDSVTSIGEYAFEGCSSLTSVNYLGTIEQWCGIKFAWGMTSPLGAKLYLNGELIEDLVIPNTVTEIKDYAFNGCTSIKSVTIPDSVTSIGDSAFSGCTSLTSINIGNSVTSIGICAFNYCTSLSSLSIPNSVISIGDYAFEDCTSLNSVELGSSVKSIGTGAFLYCSSLTSIIIPASVIYIGDEAFKDCTSLIDVNIVGNAFMQWGGYKTFYNCDSLTNLIIGDDITIIDSSLFESCDNLKNVVLGISVTKISLGAFYDCPNISNVFYKGTQTISIEGANESIIEATKYYYSETEPIEEGNYWHYVDGVVTIW